MIAKKNISVLFFLFICSHLIIWTIVPSVSNLNLPLDTIEALAWGSNLAWGYDKHPPLSAIVIQFFYLIFEKNDWAYYLLSQLCVLISFFYIWKLSINFFSNKIYPLISILILESIVFFNYTTPEYNVYVLQLPIKASLVFYFWRSLENDNISNWILTGLISALGILTHYSFVFLILGLFIFFIFFVKKNEKKIYLFILSFALFIFFISPHLLWLIDNNYITIDYALNRSSINTKNFTDHFFNPFVFIFKQLGMLIVFLVVFCSLLRLKKLKQSLKSLKDKKSKYLFCVTILPLIIVFGVSIVTGAKIRTMWMSSFYLFFGVFFFYHFKDLIDLKKIKNFVYIFLFIFILSPATYLYISVSNEFKRTDYPGKEIARLVQSRWDDNFSNEIKIVVGDEWSAGNLSYHLDSRPKWKSDLKSDKSKITDEDGVIYTGNPQILKSICPGVYGTIKPVGYCMIGKR